MKWYDRSWKVQLQVQPTGAKPWQAHHYDWSVNASVKEARVCALRTEAMHVTDWEAVQHEDPLLATCLKWMHNQKGIDQQGRDGLLKRHMGNQANTEEGKAMFWSQSTFATKKGMLYVSTIPKGESEGLLTFVVPTAHRQTALNGVHQDAGDQGQERNITLAQEHFWWLRMVNDCCMH